MAEVTNQFPIEDNLGSVRIFFAKESGGSRIWHLCDAALGYQKYRDVIYFMALHGKLILVAVRADTVEEAKQLTAGEDFCMRCLDEYEMAKETIKEKKLLKFK